MAERMKMYTSKMPTLDDFGARLFEEGGNPAIFTMPTTLQLVEFLTVKGVKIGGVYRHFKGQQYLVTDVVRDADNWQVYNVVYVQVDDMNHRAQRPVEDFLGCHPSGVRRFVLVD